jgi:hypothetical protein
VFYKCFIYEQNRRKLGEVQDLLQRVGEALYQAKRNGRNQAMPAMSKSAADQLVCFSSMLFVTGQSA